MFNSDFTLERFVIPVVSCHTESSMTTLLNLVWSSQCDCLVVVDQRQSPIGMVKCRRLLTFIAEHWLYQYSGTASLDRGTESLSSMLDVEIDLLIEPLTILTSQIRVDELVDYLQATKTAANSYLFYVVVDEQGKLLGQLNLAALTQWLLSKDNRIQGRKDKVLPTTESFDWNLLEQIPLPLMLQTDTGKKLYQNRYWQEEFGTNQSINSTELVNSLLTEWSSPPATIDQSQSKNADCLLGNYAVVSTLYPAWQAEIAPQLQKIYAYINLQANSDSFTDGWKNSAVYNLPDLAKTPANTTSLNRWQYVRLPYGLTAHQLGKAASLSSCWLVFAIKTGKSDQKDTQTNIANGEELIELNRLKDKFLDSISHELKSPLTGIVGLSSLLREQKLGNLNQRQVRYVELIYRSAKRLMNIVNDLLDVTRILNDKLELNLESVKIKPICEKAYWQVINQEKTKAEKITSSCQPKFQLNVEPDWEVVADKLRLSQILVCLLKHALKLTMIDGEIGIAAGRWANWIAITVWNTGDGIAEAKQQLTLEHFSQLETTDAQVPSKDLEILLAQQLAKAHGGRISFVSRRDRGSEFTLLLPCERQEVSPELCNRDRAAPWTFAGSDRQMQEIQADSTQSLAQTRGDKDSNRLVLVVESVSHQIEDLANKLKQLGYLPIVARTGMEALDKARQLKPRAILLSPYLAFLFGDDVLTLLKSDARTHNIPVWIITNEKNQADNYRLAEGCLNMPILQQDLAQVLSPVGQQPLSETKSLTILRLYPETNNFPDNSSWDFALNDCLYSLNHRVLEADSLEQGELLAHIWHLDAIVIDGSLLPEPGQYLRSLKECESLASLPLVILDAQTTAAANQIGELSVFPCLVPNNQQSLADVVQVIQIATGIMRQKS